MVATCLDGSVRMYDLSVLLKVSSMCVALERHEWEYKLEDTLLKVAHEHSNDMG